MQAFLDILIFSLSVTGPIFVLLAFGMALRWRKFIDDAFINTSSRLVFNFCLPTLLFVSLAQPGSLQGEWGLVLLGVIMTLLTFALLEWAAHYWVHPPADRGVVVQGAFRSNMGVIGLAYCVNAYGERGLTVASLYLGIVTILYNVLAIFTLSRSLGVGTHWGQLAWRMVSNPIIIGITLGLAVSALSLELHPVVAKSARYVADLTLPLALLCTGAALDFRSLRQALGNALMASTGKLVLIPLSFTIVGALVGFRDIELGVLFLLASAPTAAASYVMVRSYGGNSALAANLIAMTTLGSLFTTSLGILALRSLHLI